MADAAEKVSQINGAKLGANLDRLAGALDANPGALGTIIDSVKAMAEVVNHQQDQLRTMLDASRELLHTTLSNKSMIPHWCVTRRS
jgi:phospholipid/cholesterol/gamma-HCH transport system substrate-binding protein